MSYLCADIYWMCRTCPGPVSIKESERIIQERESHIFSPIPTVAPDDSPASILARRRKICHQCGEEKAIDEFPRHTTSRDGRSSLCRGCTKLRLERNLKKCLEATKLCKKCREQKPLSQFRYDKTKRDRRRAVCIDCELKGDTSNAPSETQAGRKRKGR
jgi:hypothetical protein